MTSQRIPNAYTWQMTPGARRGTWCYLILDPRGEEYVSGARLGERAEVERHVRKCVARLNGDSATSPWRKYASGSDE